MGENVADGLGFASSMRPLCKYLLALSCLSEMSLSSYLIEGELRGNFSSSGYDCRTNVMGFEIIGYVLKDNGQLDLIFPSRVCNEEI